MASRWLQLSEGSGPVDCPFDEAGALRLQRPTAPPTTTSPRPPVEDTALEGWQVQNLSDLVPEMTEAAAGADLRFHVRITVAEDTPPETRAALDKLLAAVSEKLKAE